MLPVPGVPCLFLAFALVLNKDCGMLAQSKAGVSVTGGDSAKSGMPVGFCFASVLAQSEPGVPVSGGALSQGGLGCEWGVCACPVKAGGICLRRRLDFDWGTGGVVLFGSTVDMIPVWAELIRICTCSLRSCSGKLGGLHRTCVCGVHIT